MLTGTVRNVIDFGVFVDIGVHQDGLVHISQISLDRIKHPSVVLKEGQEVQVKVIGNKDGKISLSMKALLQEKEEEEEVQVEIPETEENWNFYGRFVKKFQVSVIGEEYL